MNINEDLEVQQLKQDANLLLIKAEEVAVINGLDEEARAVEFLVQTKRRAKIVDEKRKVYTAPLKSVIDNINADFKNILEPLEKAEIIVKRGMQEFRDNEDFRRREEERKAAELAASAKIEEFKAQPSQESLDVAQNAIKQAQEALQLAPKTVDTQSGQARYRKDWKFTVHDNDSVPREFCIPDPKLIREAIKNGSREIAGVKIWEETTPIIMT